MNQCKWSLERITFRLLPSDLVRHVYAYSRFPPRMERRNRCSLCPKMVGGGQRGMRHHVRACHRHKRLLARQIVTYEPPPHCVWPECDGLVVMDGEWAWKCTVCAHRQEAYKKLVHRIMEYKCETCGWASHCAHLEEVQRVTPHAEKYPAWYPITRR